MLVVDARYLSQSSCCSNEVARVVKCVGATLAECDMTCLGAIFRTVLGSNDKPSLTLWGEPTGIRDETRPGKSALNEIQQKKFWNSLQARRRTFDSAFNDQTMASARASAFGTRKAMESSMHGVGRPNKVCCSILSLLLICP